MTGRRSRKASDNSDLPGAGQAGFPGVPLAILARGEPVSDRRTPGCSGRSRSRLANIQRAPWPLSFLVAALAMVYTLTRIEDVIARLGGGNVGGGTAYY